MDLTRRQSTANVATADSGGHAPMNAISHFRKYPPLNFTGVVRPNFDTLYSLAWIDLSSGPVVLTLPPSGGRYHLSPVLNMWSDIVAAPGWRTTGTGRTNILFVRRGWGGATPHNFDKVVCDTPYLWMIGRSETRGPDDFAAVHEFQDGMKLRMLAEVNCMGGECAHWPPVPYVDDAIDMKTPPAEQVPRAQRAHLYWT